MKTFHLLVVNTLLANVTNNFLWFALTFWVYLETQSVLATAIIGGGYMLLLAVSGMFFGTFVDRHRRKTSMLLSNVLTLIAFVVAGAVYALAPEGSLQDLGHLAFWALVTLILAGAIAGNLRSVALATTVTLLVPEDERDKANGLVGTVNGVAFAITSVFSGLAIGLLGMGAALAITIVLTVVALVHLMTITIAEEKPEPHHDDPKFIDIAGALRAVRIVPGLMALLLFSTFNNFLGGVFMALMDPYGLSLMSVEAWGVMLGITSMGFIVGGILVARRGLGANPVRTLLLANIVLWSITLDLPDPLGDPAPRPRLLPVHGAGPGGRGVRADDRPEGRSIQGAGSCLRVRPEPRDCGLAGHRVPHRTDRPVPRDPSHDRRRRCGRDRELVRDRAGARHGPDLHRGRQHRAPRHDLRPPIEGLPEPVRPIRGRAIQR